MTRPEGQSITDLEALYAGEPVRGQSAKPLRLVRERFSAWLVRDMKWHDAVPMLIGEADSLDDAQRLGEQHTGHKGTFFILRMNCETGASVQSFYVVKQKSQGTWQRLPDMAHPVQIRPMYSEHLFDISADGMLAGEKQ